MQPGLMRMTVVLIVAGLALYGAVHLIIWIVRWIAGS